MVGFCQKLLRQSVPSLPRILLAADLKPSRYSSLTSRCGSARSNSAVFFPPLLFISNYSDHIFSGSLCLQESESPMMLGDSRSDLEDVDP